MSSSVSTKPIIFTTDDNEVADITSHENDAEDSVSEMSVSRSMTPSSGAQAQDESCIVDTMEESGGSSKQDDENRDDNQRTRCIKWSKTLSTPPDCPAFTPSAEMSSLRENLHGLAFKISVDRAKILARTGKSCASLIIDIASLHDELSRSILKQYASILELAVSGTPIEELSENVHLCVTSFGNQIQRLGMEVRGTVALPWTNHVVYLAEKVHKIYSEYLSIRGKCAQARKDALKMRQKYVRVVNDAESVIKALRKAKMEKYSRSCSSDLSKENVPKMMPPRKTTERSDTSSSVISVSDDILNEEGVQWEKTIKDFGKRHGLTKHCEAVIRALEEVRIAEGQYCTLVELENEAVSDAQDAERRGLDAMQHEEEERILFVLQSLERFIEIGKTSFDRITLDVSIPPLTLSDSSNHKMLPVPSSSSLFMSPRKRAQSDDGPAIHETRMLDLPDDVALLRDNMKSHIGRQSARLNTLKALSSFNDGLASAIESFAAGLRARLESEGYSEKVVEGKNSSPVAVVLKQNEGQQVLRKWDELIRTLSDYATNAMNLSASIKSGNSKLHEILLSAERELKSLYESEETRWKFLCDAAKGLSKAKLKQKQLLIDLEKAKSRLTTADENSSGDNTDEVAQDERKTSKMTPSMNKAMGKMFSILPGGGDDVMNKVLKPEQRIAILKKNLDEVKLKESKAAESFGRARDVKNQAIATYQSESEIALIKFKADEHCAWSEMQKSLVNVIVAFKAFRDFQQAGMASDDSELTDVQTALFDDLSRWTAITEKRVHEYRARYTPELVEDGNQLETGFCVQLLLEDSTEIKELSNLLLNDNDEVLFNDGIEVMLSNEEPSLALTAVPLDPVIQKMDPIFSKRLKNVSIESYYSTGWSEETPLYGPWLEKKGSFDVSVSEWEHSKEGFNHIWSGETFPQKRVIRFKFKRTTHLYIGPPIAGVTQTQYCVLDGNDRCITMMTVEMDGIPYSDAFAVEVRWSARRDGENDIIIDAGVHVRFLKSSMFSKQIKSGTLTETKPIHLDLFERIKLALSSDKDNESELEVEVNDEPSLELNPTDIKNERESSDLLHITGLVQSISGYVLSSRKSVQLTAFFGVSFIAVAWALTRDVSSNNSDLAIADLSRKVDKLNSELDEIKSLLSSILLLMKENQQT